MELAELVDAIQVVELSAKTRGAAIRGLVRATRIDEEGFALDSIVHAVEEREATAQTIVAEGFAMPHAVIDWSGSYRVVLGRSRGGVDYGVPGSSPVHLVVLFIIGNASESLHLSLLAALAELLQSEELRQAIVEAPGTREIEQLLRSKVGLGAAPAARQPGIPRLNSIIIKQAINLARLLSAEALLVALDELNGVPWKLLASWEGHLLLVVSNRSPDIAIPREDVSVFEVPHTSLSRMDRANLGLMLAVASGAVSEQATVVCATGPGGRNLDSVTVTEPEGQLHAMFSGKAKHRSAAIRPAVILRVLALAIELAAEGREAKPVGTTFVVGDARNVQRHAKQLVLNPFHGFSRSLRSLLDPSLAETIKEFALIDGAFIIDGDGTVLSAGSYLVPKSAPKLASGLGTRHQAAAGITALTQAMAVVVSQSTGTVTVFRHGSMLLQLEQAGQTRW